MWSVQPHVILYRGDVCEDIDQFHLFRVAVGVDNVVQGNVFFCAVTCYFANERALLKAFAYRAPVASFVCIAHVWSVVGVCVK